MICTQVKPFKPVFFRSDLQDVVSPPFDVVTKDQEKALKKNPYNITHITLPESGKPENSKMVMNNWLKEGILVRSEEESFIVITQDFKGNQKDFCRIGLITTVETSPPDGIILPHESTFDWAVKDRKNLMFLTECQLEPIFLALNGISFERMLRAAIRNLDPIRTFEEPTGVVNRFFLITDQNSIESITKAISREKAIVADGHHRLSATREIYSESGGKEKEFWKYSLAYLTSLQEESLMISGIHRLMSTDFSFKNYVGDLENFFDIVPASPLDNLEYVTIYDGTYHALIPKDVAFDAIGEDGRYRYQSDPSLVNSLFFNKIMDLDVNAIAEKVSYTQSVPFAVEAVDKGDVSFAVLMPEWDKSTFLSMTEEGRIMPQKSTYFYPKIPSGLAIYCPEPEKS